jgi:hypothetical protein
MAFNTVTFTYKGEGDYIARKQISVQQIAALHCTLLKKGIDLAGAFKSAAWAWKVHVNFNNIRVTNVSQLYGLLIKCDMKVKNDKDLDSFICMRNALVQAAVSAKTFPTLTLDLGAFLPGNKITEDPTILGWFKDADQNIESLLLSNGALAKVHKPLSVKSVTETSYSTGVLEPFRDSTFRETLAACKNFKVAVNFEIASIDNGETLIKEISKAGTDFNEDTVDNMKAVLAFAIRTGMRNKDLKHFSIIADLRRVMPDHIYQFGLKEEGFASYMIKGNEHEVLGLLNKTGIFERGNEFGTSQEELIAPNPDPHIKPPRHHRNNLRFLI